MVTDVPALYDTVVTHVRRERLDREFTHRGYLWLVDIDDLAQRQLPALLRPLARFHPADHLGRPDRTIRQNLDRWLGEQGVAPPAKVLMLANARVLGYVFNPITVYWCHRPDGALDCVVAEVHNTYHQRYCYLLRPDDLGRASTAKALYVSPFLDPDGEYLMRLPVPGPRLAVTVVLRQADRTPLTATLRGTRRPGDARTLLRLVLRRPLMPQRVAALIRWHGIALWLRRVPVVPRKGT